MRQGKSLFVVAVTLENVLPSFYEDKVQVLVSLPILTVIASTSKEPTFGDDNLAEYFSLRETIISGGKCGIVGKSH